MPVKNRIQLRRGTSTQWSNSVDILAAGELGWDTNLNNIKIGDGSNLWDDLPWLVVAGVSGQIINPAIVSGVSGIFFDTSVGDVDQIAGQLGWNSEAGTFDVGLTDDVKISVGQSVLFRVKNSTGSTITKGEAVYASGVLGGGQIIQVAPFVADESLDEVRFIGLMTDDLANGEDGFVNHFGHIKNVDLRTTNTVLNPNAETWNIGDILFVDDTSPGGLTKVQPKDDIYVAMVLADGQNGELFVRITDPGHLDDLHDVNTSGLIDNNFLVWNSGTDVFEPSSGLYYVDSQLGIGTDSPNATLHVYSATSGSDLFNVEGTNGSLFSIVDSLSGLLMSVNNNAGLPVFEVYDDDSIIAGRFAQNDFVVSSSGDVGIGTDSPVSKLDVSGVITANGGDSDEWNEAYDWVQNSGLDGTGSASGIAFWTDTNSLSNDNLLVWDNTNNRLGVGVSSPTYDLDIRTDSNNAFYVTQGGGTRYLAFNANGFINNTTLSVSKGTWNSLATIELRTTIPSRRGIVIEQVASQTANALETRNVGGTPISYITSSGGAYFADKVGINNNSPAYTLDVSGSGNFTGNLIVGGDLTVNGTTVIANVDTMEVEDPILTLGLASGNVVTDTNLDRGLALALNSNTTGFMGWDTSAGSFVLLSSGVTADTGGTYTGGTYGDLQLNRVYGSGDNTYLALNLLGQNRIDISSDTYAGSNFSVGTQQTFLNSASTYLNGTFSFPKTGTATSTSTQKNSNSINLYNSMWDGSAELQTNIQLISYASTTVNERSRFAILTANEDGTNNKVERLSVVSDGNIGIGTTSPSYKLQVQDGNMALMHSAGTSNSIRIGDAAVRMSIGREQTTHDLIIESLNGGVDESIRIDYGDGNVTINEAGANIDFRVEGDADSNLLITDASTDRVGIGVSNPSYKLDTGLNSIVRVGRHILKSASFLNYGSTNIDNYIGTIDTSSNGDSASLEITVYNNSDSTWRKINLTLRNTGGTNTGFNYSVYGGGGNSKLFLKYVNRSGDASKTDLFLSNGTNTLSYTHFVTVSCPTATYSASFIEDTGYSATGATSVDLDANLALALTSTGSVGIGTASPSTKLHVYSAGQNPGMILESDSTSGAWIKTKSNQTGAEEFQFGTNNTGWHVYNNTDAAYRLSIVNGGNVGIGTSFPASKLHVADGLLRISHSSASPTLELKRDGYNNWEFLVSNINLYIEPKDVEGDLYFRDVNGTTSLQIDNSANNVYVPNGNVGIGLTNPTEKLDVSGNANISGHLSASTKSFLIDHPTKEGKKLQYGSLESPYHGVRLTGRDKLKEGFCVIKLPPYMNKLVREEDISIQITNYKHHKTLYVDDIDLSKNQIIIKGHRCKTLGELEFFWSFTAIRKDVPELVVEK